MNSIGKALVIFQVFKLNVVRFLYLNFNTNRGYGVGNSFRQVEYLCPDSNMLEGFFIKGGLERDGITLAIKRESRKEVRAEVRDWLRSIHLL